MPRGSPNGRINYEGEPTAADGRSAEDVRRDAARRARRRQRAAERALERAEAAEARGDAGAAAAVEAAEEALEEAMDAVMEADKAARRGVKARGGASRADSGAAAGHTARSLRLCTAADGEADDAAPPNFSRVDLSLPAAQRRARSPRLARARETRCELGAGDLLYLPCGWFHDVTSFDEHRALNYWFHPPDRTAFARPYAAVAFWEAEWRAASKQLRKAGVLKRTTSNGTVAKQVIAPPVPPKPLRQKPAPPQQPPPQQPPLQPPPRKQPAAPPQPPRPQPPQPTTPVLYTQGRSIFRVFSSEDDEEARLAAA